KNPWKQNPPVTRQVLDEWVTQGIVNHPQLAFEPVSFPGQLVPAAQALNFPSLPVLPAMSHTRGKAVYYTWFDKAPATLRLNATGGLIAHYRNRGPSELKLYAGIEDIATLMDEKEFPNDG